MSQDLTELKGYLFYSHYDEAIINGMGADLNPVDPSQNPEGQIPGWQIQVPGVCGSGNNKGVVVGFDIPESIYNAYVLPGVNIKRTSSEIDRSRLFPSEAGHKYRYPAPEGSPVNVEARDGSPVTVATHYRQRLHATPENIFYEIEIRARAEVDALNILRFIRQRLRHRMYLPVMDSINERSFFTLFRDSQSNTTQVSDILDRFKSYTLSYRLEGQIDDHNEYTTTGVRAAPIIRQRG